MTPNYNKSKDTSRKVSIKEIDKYFDEPLHYWDKIPNLIKEILKIVHLENGHIFPLITKKYYQIHGHKENDTLWQKTQDTYVYGISSDGKLVCSFEQNIENQYHDPGKANFTPTEYHHNSNTTYYDKSNIDKFLVEFDFNGECSYFTKWTETTDDIMRIYSQVNSKWWRNSGFHYELYRTSKNKGYGLYRCLQNILNKKKNIF